ncbi:Hercynine oxygenase [Anaerolineae bacterium]|nr:Hercynine oxygenase [Anaerolineae bacterium]
MTTEYVFVALDTYGRELVSDPTTHKRVLALKCTRAVLDILLKLFREHARDLTPPRSTSYRYIVLDPMPTLKKSYLVLRLTPDEVTQVEALCKTQVFPWVYRWREGKWWEFPGRELDKVLSKWHAAPVRYGQRSDQNTIPALLREFLNLGNKTRTGDELRARALEHGFPGEGNHRIEFEFDEGEVNYPNPFAYLLDDDLWCVGDVPIRIDAPRTPIHGDLHGGNIMCQVDNRDTPQASAPWLIDFAQSHSHRIPFFDLVYLELDILLRLMPATDEAESQDWLDATEFLCSAILPTPKPDSEDQTVFDRNQTVLDAWEIIKPIRTYAKKLVEGSPAPDHHDDCAFWIAAVAAGMMVTRRSRMLPPEKHVAALLYTSRALRQLMDLKPIKGCRRPKDTPAPVRWLYQGAGQPTQTEAQGALMPLTAQSIRAYFEGVANQQIKFLKRVKALNIDLTGHLKTLKGAADEQFSMSLGEDEDGEKYTEAVRRELRTDPMRGRHLPPEKTVTALDEAAFVPNVTEALMNHSRVVLLGEPGAGKTVTLKKLALRYIEQIQASSPQTISTQGERDAEAKVSLTSPLPVFVPLAKFDGRQTFTEFAHQRLINLRPYAADLPLVWLLDALNEMPRRGILDQHGAKPRDLLPEVVEFLQEQVTRGGKFALSCRVKDYKGDELRQIAYLDKVEISDLAPDQIQQIILKRLKAQPAAELWKVMGGNEDLLSAWTLWQGHESAFWEAALDDWTLKHTPAPVIRRYLERGELDPQTRAEALRKQETGQLYEGDIPAPFEAHQQARSLVLKGDNRRLMLACRSPYTLNMVCDLAQDGVENLPAERGDMFGRFARALLTREEEAAHKLGTPWAKGTRERIVSALEQAAETLQSAGISSGSAGAEQITELPRDRILGAMSAPDADDLLKKAEGANLIQYGESFRFSHQLLQEYFATAVLLHAMEAEESPARFFGDTWWEAGAWRETVVILGEMLRDPDRVTRWLAPVTPEVGLSVMLRFQGEQPVEVVTGETRSALVDGAQAKAEYDFQTNTWGDVNPDPHGRASAWRVLGKLRADPRPGVLDFNWSEDYWCLVLKGEYVYQGKLDKIDYDFWIARYPITYAQFQSFIDAPDGYRNPDWWLHEDRIQRQQRGAREQYFRFWNHPRESVSWYEAMAFCRWLNDGWETTRIKLPITVPSGYVLRLPLETEWEKAASWDAKVKEARVYPWGDTFDPTKANTWEGEQIGQTTTVGIYPQGASPCGALDMSGNVWEWCLNEYESDKVNIGSSEPRGLRGGSWRSSDHRARAAYRVSSPLSRLNHVGFRVVVAPVSL